MNIETRDFGNVEIEEQEVITFVQPLFGFEEYKRYVLLHDKELGNSIAWLQSTEEQQLCFILADPDVFVGDYEPEIGEQHLEDIGEGEVFAWAMCVINADLKSSTLNLKSPILINRETRLAKQLVIEKDYSYKHPFKLGET